jgi:hypothetical protein
MCDFPHIKNDTVSVLAGACHLPADLPADLPDKKRQ